MAVSAGNAVLQVVPTLSRDFSRQLATQMAGPAQHSATKVGQDAGRKYGQQFGGQMALPMGRAADRTGQQTGKRLGGKIGGGLKAATVPMIAPLRLLGPAMLAAFGGAALMSGIRAVTDEAREAAIVGKQTAAVLKSTGGAANISAKGVEQLATALSNKAGVDDEVIQTSQNLLLTFTGIRNEVGKGNDVFNQASTAIVDMTAAMNGGQITASGLKTATLQVGKALNDPIKGMTALSRAGVQFTDSQKEQIRTLVESGDKLGAQKIILAELRKEFGGSAAASADAGKRFGVFVANLKEQIGTALLPVMNRLLEFLVNNLPGALATVGRWFGTIRGAVADVVGWFQRAGAAAGKVLAPALRSIAGAVVPAVEAFVRGLLPGLRDLWKVVQSNVLPVLKVLAAIIGVTLYAALRFILPLLLRIAGPVLGAFVKAIATTIKAIGDVIRWIGRLYGAFLRWITGTKTTREALLRLATVALRVFRTIFNGVSNTVIGMLRMFGKLPGPLGAPFRKAADAAQRAKNQINTQMDRIQQRINRLRGKDFKITAEASVRINRSVRLYLRAANVPGFHATGGPIHGPGTGTSDSIPAMLSAGEHVWTAKEVQKAGGHRAVEQMRREVRGYATGGAVSDIGRFESKVGLATQRLGTRVAKFLASAVGRGLSKAIEKGIGGGRANVKAFIRSVDRLPYIWGGAGPRGYDCSGLVGAVHLAHLGKPYGHGQRIYTTSSIRAGTLGLKPGLGGTLQIGVTSGSGHMAGRYGGLGFEAESTRTGIKIGAAASRPESFARKFHLAKGGPVDWQVLERFARAGADIGGDEGKLRVNGQVFDRGGTLSPGLNLLANRTGRPEPLVPAGQGIDYDRLAKAVAKALRDEPPVTRVTDVHNGLLAKKGRRGGMVLGLS